MSHIIDRYMRWYVYECKLSWNFNKAKFVHIPQLRIYIHIYRLKTNDNSEKQTFTIISTLASFRIAKMHW